MRLESKFRIANYAVFIPMLVAMAADDDRKWLYLIIYGGYAAGLLVSLAITSDES